MKASIRTPKSSSCGIRVSRTYEGKFGKEVTSAEHRAGWDATFSAPKSVSLTALVGGDDRVREAHRESVRVALRELERYTQARIGNVHAPETTGKFIAAIFEHDTARPVDGYATDKQHDYAKVLVQQMASTIGDQLAVEILSADQSSEEGIFAQRERVKALKEKLANDKSPAARDLLAVADMLVKKSVWIIGGDGWGYDIGYGGLDHVLASTANVNILLLDTEVYSNTGGQMSKSTPLGAVAKFAAGGKHTPKKDIAMMAMNYGRAYVAHVAMGGSDTQTMKAFLEAEAYDGPSLIIAYSHCIAHGYDMVYGIEQQKAAVNSGHWPLFRYNPGLAKDGKNPFVLDSRAPSIPLEKYIYNETRYTMLVNSDPDEAKKLLKQAQENVNERWKLYQHMAAMNFEQK